MKETKFKKIFKEAMALSFPQGCADKSQLSDLIRTFSMGWAESVKCLCDRMGTNNPMHSAVMSQFYEWLKECKQLCSSSFVPDDSWMWW